MFDVLVYLYENYWRPDACPDHDQLTRKLSSVVSSPTKSRKRCRGSMGWQPPPSLTWASKAS